HLFAAGKLVLRRQLVDLVLFAESFAELQKLSGEVAALVAGAIPQLFEVGQLLVAHRLLKLPSELRRRARFLGKLVEVVMRFPLSVRGLVRLQNAPLALT